MNAPYKEIQGKDPRFPTAAWLGDLDLIRPPFCLRPIILIQRLASIDEVEDPAVRDILIQEKFTPNGGDVTIAPDIPEWVLACWAMVELAGMLDRQGNAISPRDFMLYLEKHPNLQDSIDSLTRLSDRSAWTKPLLEMLEHVNRTG